VVKIQVKVWWVV